MSRHDIMSYYDNIMSHIMTHQDTVMTCHGHVKLINYNIIKNLIMFWVCYYRKKLIIMVGCFSLLLRILPSLDLLFLFYEINPV